VICESCHEFMQPLAAVHVKFDDEDKFFVCQECAPIQKGGILDALNRIRNWDKGSLATT